MAERPWEIGICGTFDVANYGDLLFPLIAEAALAERLGPINLHRFSYHAKSSPTWPYDVTSVTALPRLIRHLDGLLIGGGFIIRFDKEVAPGYAPPTAEIHHPTGYWLTPALIALQHDVPVLWNAPGMHCNEIPTWAHPLMAEVLRLSRYVAVRDEPSRAALQQLSAASIDVVPDTAFAIPRLLNLDTTPSSEFNILCEAAGLDPPYLVIQATLGLEGFVRFLKNRPEPLRGFKVLALPIGLALGERPDIIDVDLPGLVCLPNWPAPRLIAELIGRSEAVVGHSYHLFITALALGVPVFTLQDLSAGKYSALQRFDGIFALPPTGAPDAAWFAARLGRTAPSPSARATDEPLARHWDRIAAALRAGPSATAGTLNQFWQTLPMLLEDAALQHSRSAAALDQERACASERQQQLDRLLAITSTERDHPGELSTLPDGDGSAARQRVDEALRRVAAVQQEVARCESVLFDSARLLDAARGATAARDVRIAEMTASLSWKLTTSVRYFERKLRKYRDRQ